MSAFVNIEEDRLKKMKKLMLKKSWVSDFLCIAVAVDFTYFETLTVYRNTRRVGCVSEKALKSRVESSVLLKSFKTK